MTRKTVSIVLLLFLALGGASSGASGSPGLASGTDNVPIGIDQVGDRLLVQTTGGKADLSCLGAIAVFTVSALALGAATGGAGLAIAGPTRPSSS